MLISRYGIPVIHGREDVKSRDRLPQLQRQIRARKRRSAADDVQPDQRVRRNRRVARHIRRNT